MNILNRIATRCERVKSLAPGCQGREITPRFGGNALWVLVLSISFFSLVFSSRSSAQSTSWAVDANGDWFTPGNWSNGSPNSVLSVANVNFNITAPRTITLNSGITLGILNIGDPNAPTADNPYTISGTGTITFNYSTSTAQLNKSTGQPDVISVGVIIRDRLDANISSGTLTLGGPVTIGGSAATEEFLNKVGGGTLNITGNLFMGNDNGSGGADVGTEIIQNGGTMNIAGVSNTISRPVSVVSGTLNIGSTTSAATTNFTSLLGSLVITGGTTNFGVNGGASNVNIDIDRIFMNGSSTAVLNLQNGNGLGTTTLNGDATHNTLTLNGGILNIWNGTNNSVVLSSSLAAAGARLALNFSSILSFNGTAAQNLTFTGLNSTATTTIIRSTAGTATLTIGGDNIADVFNGQLNMSGAAVGSQLIKQGTETLTLGGTVDNSASRVRVSAGTLILAKTSSATVRAIGTQLLINSGGVAQIDGTFAINSGSVPVANWVDQIAFTANVSFQSNASVLDLNGRSEGINGITDMSNGAGTLALPVLGTITNTAANTTSVLLFGENNAGAANVTTFFGGQIINGAAGTGLVSFWKSGSNNLTFTGNNTYTGETLVARATLSLTGASGALSGTSAVKLSTGGTLLWDDSTQVVNNRVSLGADLILTKGGSLTIRRSNTNGTASNANLGDLIANSGFGLITIDHTDGGGATSNIRDGIVTMNFTSYTHQQGGILGFRETANSAAIGFSDGVGIADGSRVNIANTNGWLAGDGSVGTVDTKILIGAIGGINNNALNQFVTVEGGFLRVLNSTSTTDFATTSAINDFGSATGNMNSGGSETRDNNAFITGNVNLLLNGSSAGLGTLDGDYAVNSWLQNGSGIITISDQNVLHVGASAATATTVAVDGSGMMLFNAAATFNGGDMNFGTREAILYLNANVTIRSDINGSGGLTKGGGSLLELYGQNTYTGVTTINSGETRIYTHTGLGVAGSNNGTVVNGTALSLNSGINVGDEELRLNLASGASPTFQSIDQVNTWDGNVYLNPLFETGQNNNLTFQAAGNGVLVINGDVTGASGAIGGTNVDPSYSNQSGRGLIFTNSTSNTTDKGGIITVNGSIFDEDFSGAVGNQQKLNTYFRGYSGTTVPTNSDFNVFLSDMSSVNGIVDLRSGYVHIASDYGSNAGLGTLISVVENAQFGSFRLVLSASSIATLSVGSVVTGQGIDVGVTVAAIDTTTNTITLSAALLEDVAAGVQLEAGGGGLTNTTIIRQNDGGNIDRAGTVSALLMTKTGTSYRSSSFSYGENNVAYSSKTIGIIGAETTTGAANVISNVTGQIVGVDRVTFGDGRGSYDMNPISASTNFTVGAGGVASGSFTMVLTSTTGLQVGMGVSATGIPAGTVIVAINTATNTVTLSAKTTAAIAAAAAISFPSTTQGGIFLASATTGSGNQITVYNLAGVTVGATVTGTNIPAGTTVTAINGNVVTLSNNVTGAGVAINNAITIQKTSNFAETRLYQAAGGVTDIRMRFTDDGGFNLNNEVGALTKVGRGMTILSGSTAGASDLDGGINVFGGRLMLYYGNTTRTSRVSGGGATAAYQLTLAGGELQLQNISASSMTENFRGTFSLRAGNSTISAPGGSGNQVILNLGMVNTTASGGNGTTWREPDRYAGGTLNVSYDSTGTAGLRVYLSENAPSIGYVNNTLGYDQIVPYMTVTFRDASTFNTYTDFATLTQDGELTLITDTSGAASNGDWYQHLNNVSLWDDYASIDNPSNGQDSGFGTGYMTDSELGGTTGFTGTLSGSPGQGTTLWGVRAIRFAANNTVNNTLNLGTTNLVLGTDADGDTQRDGGSILVSNTQSANQTISGGTLTSAYRSVYFSEATMAAPYDQRAVTYTSRDLIILNYNTSGTLTITSRIINNAATSAGTATDPLNLVISGPGVTHLQNVTNSTAGGYTGKTYVSGSGLDLNGLPTVGTLWISSEASLGVAPGLAVTDSIHLNGGRLRFAADTNPTTTSLGAISLNANRGITLGGNGGYIEITNAGTTLTYTGVIQSEESIVAANISSNQLDANYGVGDFIKEGNGRLILTNSVAENATNWNAYYGITEVKAGTLQLNIAADNSGILGSNDSTIDSTVVSAGATLELQITGSYVNGTNEWITLDGGTLGTTASHVDGTLDGVISVNQASTLNVQAGTLRLNVNAAYVKGTGNLTKNGAGTVMLYENNSEYTGNWTINNGKVIGRSQGSVLGEGTTVTLGDNTAAAAGTAGVYLQSRTTGSAFTTEYEITHDITVRAEGSATQQIKEIGAVNDIQLLGTATAASAAGANTITLSTTANVFTGMAVSGTGIPAGTFITAVNYQTNVITLSAVLATGGTPSGSTVSYNSGWNNDRYTYSGDIALQDDLSLVYRDSTSNVTLTNNAANPWGSDQTGRNRIVALDGNVSGAGNLTTVVEMVVGGANTVNAIFELNGDNSTWTGDLTTGNATNTAAAGHTVRIGGPSGATTVMSIANDLTIRNNATFQVAGHTLSIGNLTVDAGGAVTAGTGAAARGIIIENASNDAGTLRVNQTINANWDVLFQNGTTPDIYTAISTPTRNNVLNLTKAGAATATLTQTNTYTGVTTINDGNLRYGINQAINFQSAIVINNTVGTTSALDINNFTGSALANNNVVNSITFGGVGATATSTNNVTLGTGHMTLAGAVTYDATNNPLGSTISGTGAGSTSGLILGNTGVARAFNVGDSTNAVADLTITAKISQQAASSVVKNGAGTMVLNNTTNSSYTGGTTINAGVLQVGIAGVGTTGSSGATTVGTNSTLAGTGTVTGVGTTTLVGTGSLIKPGDSAGNATGTLTISGAVVASAAGSSIQFQLQSTTSVYSDPNSLQTPGSGAYTAAMAAIVTSYANAAAVGYDKLTVGGALTIGADSLINVAYTGGTTDFNVGSVFNLIDWASITSTGFDTGGNVRPGGTGGAGVDMILPTLGAGKSWDTSQFLTSGLIVVVGVIPEPSRFLLLGFGIAALIMRRRRPGMSTGI